MPGVILTAKTILGEKVLKEYYERSEVGLAQRAAYDKVYVHKKIRESPLSFQVLVKPGLFQQALQSQMLLLQLQNLLSEKGLRVKKDYTIEVLR